MKNYLYCRVSTDDKDQELDRQLFIGNNYAKINGFEYDSIFGEKISGGVKADERKEFSKMLSILEEGDTVHVTETSRLGRNYIDCFAIMDLLNNEYKCNIHFISNGITSTSASAKDCNPYEWLTLSQMMIFDEFNKRLICYNTKKGLAAKKQMGIQLGRKKSIDGVLEEKLKKELKAGNKNYTELSKEFGVSIRTIANYKIRFDKEEEEEKKEREALLNARKI